jgi:hypothetical protein
MMAQKTELLPELRRASTSDVMCKVMINSELAVLESQPGSCTAPFWAQRCSGKFL